MGVCSLSAFVMCDTDLCLASVNISDLPSNPESYQACLHDELITQGWSVVDNQIFCPLCTVNRAADQTD